MGEEVHSSSCVQGALSDCYMALNAAMGMNKATSRGQEYLAYTFNIALCSIIDEMEDSSRALVCDYLEIEPSSNKETIAIAFRKFAAPSSPTPMMSLQTE